MLDLLVYCLHQRCFSANTLTVIATHLNGNLKTIRARLPLACKARSNAC